MTIQIPQGAKTMQLFDMNIDIPEGKTYIDIDDNFLQNKYNQFMQNNQQQNNFNSQEELALDGKPMSMYQAPQVSQNEPQEQGVWSKINKGLEDFNNLIDPKRMISEGLDYLSPRVTSGEEGVRQKIEDATNQISGGLLARNFTSLDNEEQKQIFQIAYDEIKKLGYEPFLEINNGDYKYIGVDKNGKEVDFTPSFRNTLASTKNELAFSVAGGYAGSLAKTAGQTIAKKALNYFAPSAIGAGSGAVSDLHSQSNNTGIEVSHIDYAKRFGSAAAEDALAGAVVGSAIKGIGKTYKSVGDLISSAKTGARAGKDMIDGMAVKGGNLGNRVIDKITQKDIPMIGKFTDGGLQNAETIFNNLTKNVENKKQIDELIAKENPTYLENGKPTIEILKNIVEQGLNKNNPQFIQDSAKRTSSILKNISNALQGVPTTQRREILLKSAQAYPEIGSFLDDVLKADKDASISFLNIIKEQDEVFKNKTGLNGEFDYKAWQKDNHAYENRINQEYGSAISKLDELNNGKIVLTSEDLAKLENFKNNNFLEQDVKNNIQSYLDEIKGKEVSAEQIFGLRTAINKQLNTGNKTYNTKQAYGIVKEILDDALIRNASDKVLAKEILDNANKNFALKENFKESYLGMMKPQETKEGLTDRLVKGLRNINEDKNLENAFKGMNEQERLANETHVMNSLLAKHRIEDIGYDFKNLAKDLEDVNFSSKKIKDAKDVINTYALIYNNNRDLIMTALASSGKKTNSSMATTIQGVFDRILISGIFARLHALAPFVKSAKEQALRNQILDAIKLAKTNKEVISNLKNIKIADQEQSRIFKDALDNYIKVDKEQNKILKDALIKEGVIKGDNFFMDKADPKDNSLRFIGKNGKEYTINKDVRNEWMKTFNLKNIDDEYIPNIPKEAKIALKDREIKLTKGSLLKLIEKDRIKYIPHIKETLESPQAILKDKDDFIFIKNIDNQTYFTSIGKDYETHLTIISNSPKKQNNIKNKMKNAEVVYYNNARALPTSRASSETKQVSFSNENSTQAKPKKNLMDDIKDNIKNKEIEKKNKKSVKQRLDEKIQNDKKASEDILKRYDNFLKENKDYNFDFLDNMNLNTVEYNLTRQMIINAKESTNKGVKKDIPSALRGKIEQELNIQPLKEFGENYAEYYHDGKGALQKLLIEKQGQVAGAFHRKDLGDIDLVWGDGNFGLSHIVNRREEDFIKQGLNKIEAKNKALNFIKEIENIINNGNVKKGNNRAFIEVKNSRVMVALDYKGKDKKWIITAYNFY
ncbi:TPA: PBECR2 nuclease fold domain-containing protein [Campylobacter jejuni]